MALDSAGRQRGVDKVFCYLLFKIATVGCAQHKVVALKMLVDGFRVGSRSLRSEVKDDRGMNCANRVSGTVIGSCSTGHSALCYLIGQDVVIEC